MTHQGSTAATLQQTPIRTKKKKAKLKPMTVAMYISAFVVLVAMISIGYEAPQETATSNATDSAALVAQTTTVTADDVVAASVAASVAQTISLPVAANVAELSVSTQIKSAFSAATEANTISKPQIVELSTASRSIGSYVAQAGDTVQTIAQRYGVSDTTIKWENDLTSNTVAAGTTLRILPTSGITYVVADGDTIESIATKYGADASRIRVYNDLDTTAIRTGLKIIVPNGQLPAEEQPGYVQPRTATYITGYSAGFSGGRTWYIKTGTPNNGAYAYGNCTAYSFDRRAEMGRPIGRNWGNAGAWAFNAQLSGYRVDRIPEAGAVIQDSGHVGIVEEVLDNGDLRLSEMNAYVSGGGWNVVSGRILPAASVGQYLYIH